MIIITNPSFVEDEILILNCLLEEGLSLLHVRKPDFSKIEMVKFLKKIQLEFRDKLVLHHYHELAKDFGIERFHFSEKERINCNQSYKNYKSKSTSTHSIEDFNSLENFDYVFLSPVFKSISKENYSPEKDLFEELKLRTNQNTKVVALGGIDSENIHQVFENGFDDIALLGSIWKNENPLKQFKLCQKIALSYSQSPV